MFHRHTTGAVMLAALVTCLQLAGCAGLPSGHHGFSILAGGPKDGASWSLKGLASHGRIRLSGHMPEEANRTKVSDLSFTFRDDDINLPSVALYLEDPKCSGAYSLYIDHRTKPKVLEREYFDAKLDWGKPLEMSLEWWPDGRLVADIKGLGSRTVSFDGRARDIVIHAAAGGLSVADLDYENLDSR